MPLARTSAKLVAFTTMIYVPGGTKGKRYVPSALVVSVCETFVPALVRVTLTLGTAAPLGSVTVPVITPCTVWDRATPHSARSRTDIHRAKRVRTRTLHPLYLKK